jgi:hypothetical protein
VVGLYLHPPERAIVVCVDEKAQIQALDRTAASLPLRPGSPERRRPEHLVVRIAVEEQPDRRAVDNPAADLGPPCGQGRPSSTTNPCTRRTSWSACTMA